MKVEKIIGNKNVVTIIYRKQGFGFFGFIVKVKNLTDFTNSFSPNENGNNIKIILKYFQLLETKNFFHK